MKKFIVMAMFGLAGLAAFAGTCVVTHISLVSTDGTHDTFAGQLDNTSGVNILQHNFVIAFLDSGNNVVETKSVSGCLRSVQNGSTDFFSAVSNASASTVSTGLARIAFDSTFKVGTTSSQNTSITNITANRTNKTLSVKGKITNNDSATLIQPTVCVVVRTSAGNVLITGTDSSINDLSDNEADTFSVSITIPADSTADSVDVWVDGLDSSDNPTTPDSVTGTDVKVCAATNTPVNTRTATNTGTVTSTPTSTVTATPTITPSAPTQTPTSTASFTPTGTGTATPTPTNTAISTTATSTPCN